MKAKKSFDQQIREIIKERKQLTTSIALIITMVVLLLLIIIPQARSAYEGRKNLIREKETLSKLRAKATELDEALVSPEFLEADLVHQTLPSNKPLLELLTGLGNVIAASGVKLERLEFSPGLIATDSSQLTKVGKKNIQDTLDLEIDVSGTFTQVEDFMNMVEEMAPFTTISKFSLSDNLKTNSAEGADKNQSKVKASLVTKTHFFAQTVNQTLEKPLGKITDEDRRLLRELASFEMPNLIPQDSIVGGGQEDLFGVEGYAQELRQFYLQVKE